VHLAVQVDDRLEFSYKNGKNKCGAILLLLHRSSHISRCESTSRIVSVYSRFIYKTEVPCLPLYVLYTSLV
jgi:hypothetical protein